MKDSNLVHVFEVRSVRVEVRTTSSGRDVQILVLPQDVGSGQQLQLAFTAWICTGSSEARELSRLLRNAAELAAWIEGGGKVELWSAEGAGRRAFDSN